MPAIRAVVIGMVCLLAAGTTLSAEEVAGNVTLNGKPLPSGRIFFYLDDDEFVGSKIKDGAYRIGRVPVGAWRVEIESEKIAPDKSPSFRANIKAGGNTRDFDVKGR